MKMTRKVLYKYIYFDVIVAALYVCQSLTVFFCHVLELILVLVLCYEGNLKNVWIFLNIFTRAFDQT